jgi:hypothetical protein
MISERERRQADLFYADLMGLATSRRDSGEEDAPWPNLRSGRVIFYDEDTLRYLDGWTRATGSDDIYLINRNQFDPIRNAGRRRVRDYEDYLRRTIAGYERDLMPPLYVIHPSLHTVPLASNAPGDWDDLMIDRLIAAGRRLTIQPEADQWTFINRLFDLATQAAQAAGRNRIAQEFVGFFVLDVSAATLRLVQATNVTMDGDHAVIPISHATFTGGRRVAVLAGNANERLVGDIHTHALLDPDATSTATGMRTGMRLIHGVSDVDVAAARTDRFVVYAIDSRFLHRANPDGSKNDRLKKKGNVLREALRIFGGEPALTPR